jgi:hypothetical protein
MTATESIQLAEQRAREYCRRVDQADIDAIINLFSAGVLFRRPL